MLNLCYVEYTNVYILWRNLNWCWLLLLAFLSVNTVFLLPLLLPPLLLLLPLLAVPSPPSCHAMLRQPCNVSCCIWKELSEYTNEEYENEEICIVNCRFFVCFILFVLTMFSLLFFTCTHFMFSLRVFYIFSIFVGINVKKNSGRCMPCIIFSLLFIVHNIFFGSFWIFVFHISCSSLHHFMLYFILFHIFSLNIRYNCNVYVNDESKLFLFFLSKISIEIWSVRVRE